MKRYKRVLRVLALSVFMLLAVTGIGLTGAAPALARNREKYLVQTEQTENREDEDEETQTHEKI